jgi:methyl-accepting chemotaxis protein
MLTAPATAIMNQVSISKKMLIISIAFLIPLVIIQGLFVTQQITEIDIAKKEQLGIRYVTALRQLIQHFPEHRGMTNAYLSGAKQLKTKISSKRQQISQDIAAIDIVNVELGAELRATSDWQRIKATWQGIKNDAFSTNKKTIFARHTELVSQVLGLVSNVSDRSGLTMDPELESFYIAASVVNSLPQIVENLGQARGMASGLAVRGEVSIEENGKL